MNRDQFSGLAVGLTAGLLVAVLAGLFGYQIGRAGRVLRDDGEPVTAAPASSAPAAPAPAAPAPAAPAGVPVDASQQIAAATQVVQTDPKNRQAWVALGNLYFDTHQPQKSIDAYARALELQPDDPDVLTDQGVMFRAAGAYDKAVANFQKANRLRPEHLPSLYNLGVVYAFDLKDVPKAEEAWNKLIQLAPSSENATQARAALAQLKGK
jgi:tetratricopeptide (TPR) repeat protein